MPDKEKDEEGSVVVDINKDESDKGTPWVDPGAQEGVKKDPRVEQNKLTPDTPRFQEIYKSMKKGEEKIAELEKKVEAGSGNAALIEEMRRHNESLEKAIKQSSGNIDSNRADDAIKGLETKLGELKTLKKSAREEANFDSETEIDEKMADLRVEIRDGKKAIEAEKKVAIEAADKTKKAKDSELSDDDKVIYNDWIADNSWYTKEPKKKAAAIAFEKKVVKEPEFADSTIMEILEEVGKRVEEKFKPAKRPNTVEDGSRLGSIQIPGSVRLSPTEMEVAKGLGIAPEKYARQKATMASAGGK
jgi:hypothetical protein